MKKTKKKAPQWSVEPEEGDVGIVIDERGQEVSLPEFLSWPTAVQLVLEVNLALRRAVRKGKS